MNNVQLKAPFPYFGGKSRVAHLVWKYLGQPKHYIEPFFGSGAVLLQRPDYNPEQHVETVNDKDGFVCNVWRSLKFSPEKTAEWADWPVNHADLSARRLKLVKSEGYLLENLGELLLPLGRSSSLAKNVPPPAGDGGIKLLYSPRESKNCAKLFREYKILGSIKGK